MFFAAISTRYDFDAKSLYNYKVNLGIGMPKSRSQETRHAATFNDQFYGRSVMFSQELEMLVERCRKP